MITPNPTDQRRALAQRLADACPPDFASEIAITGSTARGRADETSDLEMNFWRADTIPELDLRFDWLTTLGAEKFDYIGEHEDSSDWIDCQIDGIPCEIGFQTFDALETLIAQMLDGIGYDTAVCDLIIRAVPLRSSGWLAREQARLAAYSDAAYRTQCVLALKELQSETLLTLNRWIERGARLALIDLLVADVEETLRLAFALNRRWMPSRKWMLHDARELLTLPPEFFARIDGAFVGTEREIVDHCAALIRSTIDLIPATDAGLNAMIAKVRPIWGG
ncbi:MAG: DUF4037 domain-containing protein [Chloroflexota bacterium]|nr:DUF4037 domain-containing protein [Chloroflexota bacterium]